MSAGFNSVKRLMNELFAKDCVFALATASGNVPSVRFVDTYYCDCSFYVVTYVTSRKVKEIAKNPNVSIASSDIHSFSGIAENIGHPLRPENAEIRSKLVAAFAAWYFLHNDEKDADMCIIKITPSTGFIQTGGRGYSINFTKKEVTSFPFEHDIVLPVN